jgi:tetratricopeptide (TPR) repeat protein
MVAINSHAILPIAKDCARLKPDLFIIYAGNNEVVGPYGAGTIFSTLSKNLSIIRINIAIKTTRVGQLLNRLAAVTSRSDARPETWGGLEMFLSKQIRHDDDKMQYVYSHFRHNLEDIIKTAQKSGAKTIVSTVGVNLKDCPPFASMHKAGLDEQQKQKFDDFYQAGLKLEKLRDFSGAIEKYLAAAKIDDSFAELQFRIGQCCWNLNKFKDAEERYTMAMDLDTLRFRADSSINKIIREVGSNREAEGVYLVRTRQEIAEHGPQECPGFEFFYDHVHLTFSGNFLRAKIIFDQIERILPDKIKSQRAADAAAVGEDECARLLAFTVYDRIRVIQTHLEIIKNAPFINQAYHDEAIDFWREKSERLNASLSQRTYEQAIEQYEQAIKSNPDDRYLRLNYFKLLYRNPNYVYAAAQQCRAIIERLPHDFHALAALADMEMKMGNTDSALEHAEQAVKYMPMYPIANQIAGSLCLQTNQPEKALRYIEAAVRLNPKSAQGYIYLSALYAGQGKIKQAERVCRKGIKAVQDDASLHYNLSLLLRQKGRLKEAEKELQKAKSLDPNIQEKFGQGDTKKGYK